MFSLMTIVPHKGHLAIAVVVDVALQTDGRPISRHASWLTPRHLESVLQSLVGEGILKAIRGPHGGYAEGSVPRSEKIQSLVDCSPWDDAAAD